MSSSVSYIRMCTRLVHKIIFLIRRRKHKYKNVSWMIFRLYSVHTRAKSLNTIKHVGCWPYLLLDIGCNCISTRDLRYTFEQIYLGQQNCFRMSASLGYVLQDITNNDLSYYRPSLNNQLIFKTSNSIIKTQLDFQTI